MTTPISQLIQKIAQCLPLAICCLVVFAILINPVPVQSQRLIGQNEAEASAHHSTIVHPTGIFPDDVNHVQTAIDSGGTVLLTALNMAGKPMAFNFGTPEFLPGRNVFINVDVEIVGESVGAHRTTITGGFVPIQSSAQVKSRIAGIDFRHPKVGAINLSASAGSEISGNRIHAPVPGLVCVVPPPCPVGDLYSFAQGVGVGSYGAPQLVTGKIRITGNYMEDIIGDSSGGAFPDTFGFQADTAAADYEITDNTIRNTSTYGIAIERVQNSSVRIANNRIELGGPDASVGIFIDGDQTVAFEVAHNRVVTTAPSPFLDGIAAAANEALGTDGIVGARIHHNHVTMHSSLFGGVSLYDVVIDGVVKDNLVDGDGAYALQISTFGVPPIGIASFNRFVDNKVDFFSASVADVFLDTNSANNVVIGKCSSSLDLGVGNSVRCDREIDPASLRAPLAQRSAFRALAVKSLSQRLLLRLETGEP